MGTTEISRSRSVATDALLVGQVLDGDQKAYEQLVRKYKSLVTTFCFSRINQRELSEDLAQETFVRAFVALHNLKKPSAFSAWILSIAHNVCIDHLRNKSRTVSLEVHSEKDSQGEIILENRKDRSVVDSVVQSEIRDLTLEAIDKLGEEYRATLLLRHVQGLSCEEIAETLGVSLGTVTSRLSRAHRVLRERLQKFMEPDK
ncbi:MAG: RNA polymerase sigma factor [Planctomycetota bacterium]|nr:RNA polymerase sigma factor [Planctomycetota bacterium]